MFVPSGKVELALVLHDKHQNPLSAYTGLAKRKSPSVKPQVSGGRDRMVSNSKPSHGRVDLGPLGQNAHRSFRHERQLQVTNFPDEMAWAMDGMSISWKRIWVYTFHLFPLVPKVLVKIREEPVEIVLVALWWP